MRLLRWSMTAAGAGLAAVALVGCGSGSSLLSHGQANSLDSQLQQLAEDVGSGHCAAARAELAELQSDVSSLGGINGTLAQNLQQGVSTIASLTAKPCGKSSTVATTTTTRTRSTRSATQAPPSTTATFSTTSSVPTTSVATTTTATTTASSAPVITTTPASGGAGL